MDLSNLKTKDVGTLEVVGPDKKKTDIRIDLYSADSDIYDEAMAEFRSKIIEAGQMDGKQARELNASILAKCTKGWENIQLEGEDVKFSFENAKRLYGEPGLKWLSDQVNKFITRRENYLGN